MAFNSVARNTIEGFAVTSAQNRKETVSPLMPEYIGVSSRENNGIYDSVARMTKKKNLLELVDNCSKYLMQQEGRGECQ